MSDRPEYPPSFGGVSRDAICCPLDTAAEKTRPAPGERDYVTVILAWRTQAGHRGQEVRGTRHPDAFPDKIRRGKRGRISNRRADVDRSERKNGRRAVTSAGFSGDRALRQFPDGRSPHQMTRTCESDAPPVDSLP
jgi:hypothetical protein